jgi:succinate-semialdehyde dehydrogenase/glutarate-semialdehyde dehydrogenase
MYRSFDPYRQVLLACYEQPSAAQLSQILDQGQAAFRLWRKKPLAERGALILRLADLLLAEEQALARLMCLEMAKPWAQALAEVQKCAWLCRHYAQHGAAYLAPEPVETEMQASYVVYQPLGLIVEVMPWNFPLWQVFRFTVPTLLAGNVCLLKHAPNVPQSALAILGLFERAGFPQGVFQNAFLSNEQVAEVLADERCQGASLTGSFRAGSAVAAAAGAAVKPVVLELGGSDAFVVLADADLEQAAKVAVQSRLHNNGQTCIAAKRFLIQDTVYDQFLAYFKAEWAQYQVGDPLDPQCRLSVLARQDLAENLQKQVEQGLAQGARLLTEGGWRGGCNFQPMILSEIASDNVLAKEELFGPVACFWSFKELEQALQLANEVPFGLGASLWTRNTALAQDLALSLDVGTVAINQMVKSDPRLPFGGIKQSGLGRELGREGIRSFVNIKAISMV